jgi:1A family penicillin-binding protein
LKNRRKMREKRNHGAIWTLLVSVLIVAVIGFGAVQGVKGIINSWLEDLPSVENSDAFNYAQKTRVYAGDHTTLLAEFYVENRDPVTIDQVSPYVLQGTIATEDVRYYEHNGVDPQGIMRALFVNLQGGELEGASTITQQFVRYTILSEEATEISVERKVREIQLAIDLEKIYSKDEILMMYLNTINYGDGCYGIEAAAKNYFQVHANELSIAQAATLVGIPQSPTYLNPKTNPEACLERRNLVLDRMVTNGVITQEEYDAAVIEPLNLNPAPEGAADGIYAYPYFTSYVRQLLLDQYSSADVFKGGLTVYTTIDPNIQNMAETAAREQYDNMADDLEVSLTAVDPSNGYVKAMVGGKDYASDQFNLATQGLRHAGSSFKTFTLISAIENGIDPKTRIDCSSPVTIDGWRVENYGGASYGVRTIQNATAISSNTGYARLIDYLGAQSAYEVARKMGITSSDLQPLPSATLGAVGVSTLEMAGAYSVLASGGEQRDPVAITQIIAADQSVLFEHVDAPERVLTPEVSYATTQVLKTVFTEGTATAAALSSGQPQAGKTGTSENWRDSWLCAYTPYLSTAVWIGARQERSMPESLDCSYAWKNFMTMYHADLPIKDFDKKDAPPYENTFNKSQSNQYGGSATDAPNVSGMTQAEAEALLQYYDRIYYEEYSSTVAAGSIIRQSVADGVVVVYISLGPEPAPTPTPTPTPTPDDNQSSDNSTTTNPPGNASTSP